MEKSTEVINSLVKEHYEEYKNFTRLLLTLSVAFITFVTSTKMNVADTYTIIQKTSIAIHCASIIFGVWLQYVLVKLPILDINNYVNCLNNRTDKEKNEGGMVFGSPSLLQRSLFVLQIISFVLAFFITVVNVMR